MNSGKPSLQLRAFTSVLIATAFVALAVSGTVLFLSPPGRVANWGGWRMLGLTKHDWTGLHVWFSVVFIAAAILHLVFNLRPLLGYFKDRLTRQPGLRWEWVVAIGVCALVFVGVRADWPPFSSFLSFNEQIKRSWEEPRGAAPVPHAELLTLGELAAKAEVPIETALQRLQARGLKGATADVVVARLAERNNVTAQQVYEILQGLTSSERPGAGRGRSGGADAAAASPEAADAGHRPGAGGGPGRMTLTEFCATRSLDLQQAEARLQARGIKFSASRTLREIASDNGFDRPYELIDILEGKSK